MDGVTVGHPRCNDTLCTNSLRSPRDRFCPQHQRLNSICAVTGCNLSSEDNMRTCRTPEHRQYEEDKREEGKAFFRLKKRIDTRLAASALRGLSDDTARETGEEVLDVEDVLDDEVVPSRVAAATNGRPASNQPTESAARGKGKAKKTTMPIKGSLGRRWTHNEQLMFRPCGVVISRATFYESEGMHNALVCCAFL